MRIVFEGLPGAGKTTHAEAIAAARGLTLIPEWVGLTDKAWQRASPTIPFYFANDELKEALGRYFTHQVALFDRHYAGALAYGYALSELYGQADDGESYEGNLQWYRDSLADGRLSRPDVVLFLDIEPATSLQRQPRARAFDPLWGELRALALMRQYYRLFYEQIEPQVRVHWIDAEAPPDDIRAHLQDVIDEVLKAHKPPTSELPEPSQRSEPREPLP